MIIIKLLMEEYYWVRKNTFMVGYSYRRDNEKK